MNNWTLLTFQISSFEVFNCTLRLSWEVSFIISSTYFYLGDVVDKIILILLEFDAKNYFLVHKKAKTLSTAADMWQYFFCYFNHRLIFLINEWQTNIFQHKIEWLTLPVSQLTCTLKVLWIIFFFVKCALFFCCISLDDVKLLWTCMTNYITFI